MVTAETDNGAGAGAGGRGVGTASIALVVLFLLVAAGIAFNFFNVRHRMFKWTGRLRQQ